MIKPRLPAGNRCLFAQSERFNSINACDLMPAFPYTTETLSFSIYHALDASEPQLALLEKGLPSSLSGSPLKQQFILVFIVIISHSCLYSWRVCLVRFSLVATTLCVSHCCAVYFQIKTPFITVHFQKPISLSHTKQR